ncbi:hypothetical protein KA005_36425, partial [bacterium]|nr:hypothetical protein [bacterium]
MSYVKLSLKKKLFFSFIILVFLLLALELFSYITLNLMCLPMPSRLFGETSYMTPDRDIGWALAPGVSHHILKYPQGYDITIRTGNSYRKDGQNIRRVKDCDVITIGDSHTFGFGLKDEQTLAFQLHSLLSHDQHKCLVFNGGVPGLGPCQYYLRLRSLCRLAAGSLVIVYFNPLNDLRGLSRDVDYGNTKPYVCLVGTLIRYVRPILYNAKTPYHFSRDFDSLNQAFNTSPPSVPSEGTHLLQNSQTWQLVSDLRQKRIRPRWKQLEPTEAIDSYQDGWEHEYNRQRSFQKQALQRAGGLWPEIAEFESERRIAEEILHRIFSDMKKHVENQRAHLLVVIA